MESIAQAGTSAEQMSEWLGFTPQISSDRRGWTKGSLHLWHGHNEVSVLGALDEPTLVYHIGGAEDVPVRSGRRTLDQRSRPGCFSLVPRGTPTNWEVKGLTHSVTLHIACEAFEGLLAVGGESILNALQLHSGERDDRLTALLRLLATELQWPSAMDGLLGDALIDSIILNLLQWSNSNRYREMLHGGLSAHILKRAIERLEAAIEHGVSLQSLADEAGLSRAHFSKAFRESTGCSPHRYLVRRRIETAREKLARGSEPLTDIALACGFANQAHFTATFHREVGRTPLSYRQSHA
jgi:AraC family transcriptional regulator